MLSLSGMWLLWFIHTATIDGQDVDLANLVPEDIRMAYSSPYLFATEQECLDYYFANFHTTGGGPVWAGLPVPPAAITQAVTARFARCIQNP